MEGGATGYKKSNCIRMVKASMVILLHIKNAAGALCGKHKAIQCDNRPAILCKLDLACFSVATTKDQYSWGVALCSNMKTDKATTLGNFVRVQSKLQNAIKAKLPPSQIMHMIELIKLN